MLPVARDFQSRYQYNMVFVQSSHLDIDRVRWALTSFHSAAHLPPARQSVSPAAQGARTGTEVLRRASSAVRPVVQRLAGKVPDGRRTPTKSRG
jgi:hypothetical protein